MITTSQFTKEDLDNVLGSRTSALKNSILATDPVDEQYLNEIEFKTSDDAKDFYKSERVSPTKGCKLFVGTTLTHRNRGNFNLVQLFLMIINSTLIKRSHADRRSKSANRVRRLD